MYSLLATWQKTGVVSDLWTTNWTLETLKMQIYSNLDILEIKKLLLFSFFFYLSFSSADLEAPPGSTSSPQSPLQCPAGDGRTEDVREKNKTNVCHGLSQRQFYCGADIGTTGKKRVLNIKTTKVKCRHNITLVNYVTGRSKVSLTILLRTSSSSIAARSSLVDGTDPGSGFDPMF